MKTFKYSMAVLAGMLVIIGNAYALVLEVTSPNGGETWFIGQTQPITWKYSGPDRQLKLELLKGNQVWTIAENIPARQQTFRWKVGEYKGGKVLGGEGYKIRAKMMSSADSDSSNSPFSLMILPSQSLQEKKPSPKLEKERADGKELQRAPDKQKTIQSGLPDLVCESILTTPQNPREGDIVGPIVVTIKNKGLSTAAPSSARFGCLGSSCFPTECVGCTILGEKRMFDSDVARMYSIFFSVPSIGPGSSVQFTFRAILDPVQMGQAPVPPKWNTLTSLTTFICNVDINNEVYEGGTGEANNEKQIGVNVQFALTKTPDLICESITTSPQNPRDGDIMGPFVMTIKNRGGSTAGPSIAEFQCNGACHPVECVGCTITWEHESSHYVGSDFDRTYIKRFSVPSIGPGNSVQFTFRPVLDPVQMGQTPVPPTWKRGEILQGIILSGTVDFDNTVNEGVYGEGNNRWNKIINIQAATP